MFLWGAISLLIVPWEPFWIPNVGQSVVCAGLLVYFARTWKRPQRRIAETVFTLLIVYALLLLPWTAIVWNRLGRPLEAFAVPQGAILTIALVSPGRWVLGIVALCLFALESLFAYFYTQYVGLGALLPITEPIATFGFLVLGVGIILLRRRRRSLTQRYLKVQVEIQAFERLRPHFERTREELDKQVSILTAEVGKRGSPPTDTRARVVGRALERLADLRGKIDHLVVTDEHSPTQQDAERRMLDHDAQFGAMLLSGIGVTLAVPVVLWAHTQIGEAPTIMFIGQFSLNLAVLLLLVSTRDRPSARRALWMMLVLVAVSLPAINYNQYILLHVGRPFSPFLGHKLLMGVLGLTLVTRFRLGSAIIALLAVNTIVLWFALDLGAHREIVPYSEPWATLIYTVIGLVSLLMLEQRRIASLRLLRARAEASAMHRRALMFLALRDRLNSPLQALVLGADGATAHLTARGGQRVQAAVDRLVDLSRELAALDVLVPRLRMAIDAEHELRPRI